MQAVSLRNGSFGKRWSPGLATRNSAPPAWRAEPSFVLGQDLQLGQGVGYYIGTGFHIAGSILLAATGFAIAGKAETDSMLGPIGWGLAAIGIGKFFIVDLVRASKKPSGPG